MINNSERVWFCVRLHDAKTILVLNFYHTLVKTTGWIWNTIIKQEMATRKNGKKLWSFLERFPVFKRLSVIPLFLRPFRQCARIVSLQFGRQYQWNFVHKQLRMMWSGPIKQNIDLFVAIHVILLSSKNTDDDVWSIFLSNWSEKIAQVVTYTLVEYPLSSIIPHESRSKYECLNA